MIEFRHLHLLRAIQAGGGLSAAAQRLFLTQSAVSHQLKALEHDLGLPLVERAARPFTLTPAGRRVLQLAERVVPALEDCLRDLAKLKDGAAGELRIAVECHTCYDWLMPAMDTFRQAWPEVELDLLGGFQPDPEGLLLSGRADLIVTSEPSARSGVTRQALFAYEIVALLPHGHRLATKKYLEAPDFAAETLIAYPVPGERLDVVRRVLTPAGITPARRDAELTSAILQLVASRRGIAALPAWSVATYLAHDYVLAKPITHAGLWGELHTALRAGDIRRAYVRDFIDILRRESFAKLPGIRASGA